MSRSYREPIIKSTSKAKKFFKRVSSKKNRKQELTDGGAYKHNGCTYNISDYRFFAEDKEKEGRK